MDLVDTFLSAMQNQYAPIMLSIVTIFCTFLYFHYFTDSEFEEDDREKSVSELPLEETQRHLEEVALCAAKLEAFDGKKVHALPNLENYWSEMKKNDSMIVNVPNDLEEDEKDVLNDITTKEIEDQIYDNSEDSDGDTSSEDVEEIVKELSDTEDIKESESERKISEESAKPVQSEEQENSKDINAPSLPALSKKKIYKDINESLTENELSEEQRIQKKQLKQIAEIMKSNPSMFNTETSTEDDVETQFSMYNF